MNRHRCLTCSGEITEEQEEEEVAGRYVHVKYEDCQQSLSGRSEMSEALRVDRLRQRGGHKGNLPGLDDYD